MGTALPSQFTIPRLALKQRMFRLGRAKIKDYVIRESDKGGSKWLNAVSKCQCNIVMKSTGVFLGPLEHRVKKIFMFMLIKATSNSLQINGYKKSGPNRIVQTE